MMESQKGFNIKDSADIGLIGDHRGLNKLKKLASGSTEDKAKALVTAAQQFESLLMQYWMDGMRKGNDVINPDSPLHSKHSSFFEDMLSQQQIGSMVSGSGGLNKNSITYLITKQFAKSLGDEGKEILKSLAATGSSYNSKEVVLKGSRVDYNLPSAIRALQNKNATVASLRKVYEDLPHPDTMRSFDGPEDFVKKMMPYALKAVSKVPMNPLVLVAQAALETGWGNHVPDNNNYYGIKAGKSWTGPVQKLSSGEFENGRYVDRVSAFRAYPSVLESMEDYIALIRGNSRYEKASEISYDPDRYFEEIQKAGYATDPNYADKLKGIVRRIAFMTY